MTTVRLAVDEAVGDRYVVLQVLGEGGMGQVALVRQNLTNKLGAMKLLTAMAPELVERFNREAAAPSRLNHPAFPAVFDFGAHYGAPYIVMDFVDGETISGAMKRGHRFSLAEIVEIGRQVCDAMGTAHEAGLVHRDLKAENIMLVAKANGAPRVFVLDLGIAKFASEGPGNNATKTGTLLGTPLTMSPEQAQGQKVDGRSDIYSLGCVLFFMATGHYPFEEGEPLQIAMRHVMEPPPLASDLAPWLPIAIAQLFDQALQKNVHDRFASMAALDQALAQFAGSLAAPDGHRNLVTRASQAGSTSGSFRASAKTATPLPAPQPAGTTLTPILQQPLHRTLGSLSESNGQMGVHPPQRGASPALLALLGVVLIVGAGVVGWLTLRPAARPIAVSASTSPAPVVAASSRIRLDVTPQHARLFIDGRDLGETRVVEGKPGSKQMLQLRAEGFESHALTVVFGDRDEVQVLALEPRAAAAGPTPTAPPPVPATEAKPKRTRSAPGKKPADLPDSL